MTYLFFRPPSRLKLATVEAEKARLAVLVKSLEEQVESWLRVRDSLSKQLAENEEKYRDSQEAHMSLMKVRENNIKILEEHLDSVKVSLLRTSLIKPLRVQRNMFDFYIAVGLER